MFVIYDSTFGGLLSAAAYCFRRNLQPLAIISDLEPLPILDSVYVPLEKNVRRVFQRHLAKTIGAVDGEKVMDTVFRAFLSESEGIATHIWKFLSRAFELRRDPSARLYEPAVETVVSAARRVSGQAHQYLGLLRFRTVSPSFYVADFEPDYHVLPLILPHFTDRFSGQDFAIRDLRRNIAALHLANGQVSLHVLADGDNCPEPQALTAVRLLMPGDAVPASQDKTAQLAADCPADEYGRMWQNYLQHLSIPERKNPALQQANMPKKYWRYLTEDPTGKKTGRFIE